MGKKKSLNVVEACKINGYYKGLTYKLDKNYSINDKRSCENS